MKNQYTLWCTYHNESIPKEYNLYKTNNYKLFNDNNLALKKDNINYLHDYIAELVTYYYIWKNNLKSDIIGFEVYSKHFSNIDYNMLNTYGFFPFSGGYFLNAWDEVKDHMERYNHLHFIFIQYMKYKYDIDLLDFYNKRKNALMFFHNMYFFTWDTFCDICDFIFGFLNYIFPNDTWKKEDNIILLSNLRHNPINEFVLNENKYNWKRHLAVFYEFAIGLYLGLKCKDIDDSYTPITCPIHGCQYRYFIMCPNKINDYNKLKKWFSLNIKSGIQSFVILSDLKRDDLNFINNYVYNFNVCNNINEFNRKIKEFIKKDCFIMFELKDDEYIDCNDGIEMHNNIFSIKKIK